MIFLVRTINLVPAGYLPVVDGDEFQLVKIEEEP